jgi:hypothetical protein
VKLVILSFRQGYLLLLGILIVEYEIKLVDLIASEVCFGVLPLPTLTH